MRLVWLLCALPGLAVAQPKVTKVEPPNWFSGHTTNPVRVMVRGERLQGAAIQGADRISVNPAGTYAFFDLPVTGDARRQDLVLTTREGSVTVPFRLLQPLDAAGRFQGFSPDDVIYLLMPDRFANGDLTNDDPPESRGLTNLKDPHMYHGGDLQGVIDRLPYLKGLGVTAIWMTPVYDNVNVPNEIQKADGKSIADYHGYGAIDYYGVEEHFGTMAKLRELVDRAHALGLKVIQDQVANHVGPYHPWVSNPPLPDWFHGTAAKHLNETWQVWALNDPNATAAVTRPVLDGWFADVLPDLNQENPEVALYEVQNTLWWLGMTGMDGIRQDTLPYVPRAFWGKWTAAVKRQYPQMRVVGEVFDQDPALTASFQTEATGIDTVFDFPFYYALRSVFGRGDHAEAMPKVLAHDGLYRDASALVTFLGLHDVERFLNEKQATIDTLRQAFTVLLTTRGTPMIYYGDEIGMRGGNDPDNRRDFPVEAFRTRTEEQDSLYRHVNTLLQMRKEHLALRQGVTANLVVREDQWVYSRTAAQDTVIVAVNSGANEVPMRVPVRSGAVLESAFGPLRQVPVNDGFAVLTAAAHSTQVFVVR